MVAQVNDQMPWTSGDALIPEASIDLMIEADGDAAHGTGRGDRRRVGADRLQVAERVPDGATLQAGIGAVPDAALRGLATRHGLRVWTEMFSDSVLALEQAGALDRHVPISRVVHLRLARADGLGRRQRAHRDACAPRSPTTRPGSPATPT